jgi:ubiquinone/menaquinone biosynthesis C-methylase UbiE
MPYAPFPNQEYRNFFQTKIELPTLLRLFPIPPRSRVLEVGCGRGVALPLLAKRCRPDRLVGLDIADDLLAVAEKRLRRMGVVAELHPGDVRQMPFASGEFDVVIDFGTCYHVDAPESAIREISRVLAPGGSFIHETPFAQLLAHPVRTSGRRLPWRASSELVFDRAAVLWASRRKQSR